MEKIIQIQVCGGADGKPFITALTQDGVVYVSWNLMPIVWEQATFPNGV